MIVNKRIYLINPYAHAKPLNGANNPLVGRNIAFTVF